MRILINLWLLSCVIALVQIIALVISIRLMTRPMRGGES